MRSTIDRRTKPPVPPRSSPAPVWTRGLYVLYAACVLAVLVAIANNHLWSSIAYGVVVVVASIVLFRSRAREVRRARGKGANTVVGFKRYEIFAVVTASLACMANAIIFAIYVAGRVG